jgi:LacI family transcriptional regulator
MAITSRDIAKAAGVSQATVSRVLNGSPRVTEETRARVVAAMEAARWVPNAQAKAMRTAKAGAIGIVTSEIQNPFLPYLLDELTRVAREIGVNVVVWNDDDPEMPLATAGLAAGTVDGVMFTAARSGMHGIDRLIDRGVPVLLANRADTASTADIVMTDHRGTGERAAEFLLDHGRRDIAAVFGPDDTFASPAREAGFRAAMHRGGATLGFAAHGVTSYETGFAATRSLLEQGTPDAIFCSSDIIAYGALDALRGAGIDVPGTTWVVGIDGLPMSSWRAFDLTTFEQDVTAVAHGAVERLLARIDGETSEARHALVPARLVERGSTATT